MLNVVEKSEELAAPARTIEELHERLGVHIGRTVRLQELAYAENQNYPSVPSLTSFGPLKHIIWAEGDSVITADLGRTIMVRNSTHYNIDLTDSISVLVDGMWRLIHSSEKKED